MPKRVPSHTDGEDWTADLPLCENSGIGYGMNISYRHNGQPVHNHPFEDDSLRIKHESGVCLYGIFDGHEGKKVATYATQKLPAELLFGQLHEECTEEEIKEVLRQSIKSVDDGYFANIGDMLAKRTDLLSYLQGMNTYEATTRHPEIVGQLAGLDHEIMGGSTALVAVIVENKLYVANVGNSRALLCKQGPDDQLRVFPLSVPHDITNRDEVLRLRHLGLSEDSVRHFVHTTRCLGDYRRRGGYKDFELLSKASSEPVIATPELYGGFPLDEQCRFLILASDGVYSAWEAATGSLQCNVDIAKMVATAFSQHQSLNAIAQAVVDEVGRKHHEVFLDFQNDRSPSCQQRDDMTLLVRNFNQPLTDPNSSGVMWPMFRSDLDLSLPTVFDDGAVTLTESTLDDNPAAPVVVPLDENGCIQPYVDFSPYWDAMKRKKNQESTPIETDSLAPD